MLRAHDTPRPRWPAGFSLIEVMIAVAILGVIATLAVPQLLPEVFKAQREGAAESAANLLFRARSEAMSSRRCVRVFIETPTKLTVERLNSFDCDKAPATSPKIAGTAVWIPVDSLTSESPNITFSVAAADGGRVGAQTVTGATPGGSGGGGAFDRNEIRFRPNGRLFSNNVTGTTPVPVLNDDDAVLVVKHNSLTAARKVLVDGNGLICTFAPGVTPPGTAPDFFCP